MQNPYQELAGLCCLAAVAVLGYGLCAQAQTGLDVVVCVEENALGSGALLDVADNLRAAAESEGIGVRYGIAVFSHHGEGDWLELSGFTNDAAPFLDRLSASGGSTRHDECDLFAALERVCGPPSAKTPVAFPWDDRRAKLLVVCAETPPASPDWQGRTFDDALASVHRLKGATVCSVLTSGAGSLGIDRTSRVLRWLAFETGGKTLDKDSAHEVGGLIKETVHAQQNRAWRSGKPPYLLYAVLVLHSLLALGLVSVQLVYAVRWRAAEDPVASVPQPG